MAKVSKFGSAFAAARKAGKKEFTFGGKKYHTRTKEDMSVSAKDAPTPKARPSAKSGASRSTAGKASPKSDASSKKQASSPRATAGAPKRNTRSMARPAASAQKAQNKYQATGTPTGVRLMDRKTYRRK